MYTVKYTAPEKFIQKNIAPETCSKLFDKSIPVYYIQYESDLLADNAEINSFPCPRRR